MTEIAFDYKQKEEEAVVSIAAWRKKLDALLLTNKASGNDYLTDLVLKPDKFFKFRTPYQKLASDKWAHYKPNMQKQVKLM